jgi:hypothetical protein
MLAYFEFENATREQEHFAVITLAVSSEEYDAEPVSYKL